MAETLRLEGDGAGGVSCIVALAMLADVDDDGVVVIDAEELQLCRAVGTFGIALERQFELLRAFVDEVAFLEIHPGVFALIDERAPDTVFVDGHFCGLHIGIHFNAMLQQLLVNLDGCVVLVVVV